MTDLDSNHEDEGLIDLSASSDLDFEQLVQFYLKQGAAAKVKAENTPLEPSPLKRKMNSSSPTPLSSPCTSSDSPSPSSPSDSLNSSYSIYQDSASRFAMSTDAMQKYDAFSTAPAAKKLKKSSGISTSRPVKATTHTLQENIRPSVLSRLQIQRSQEQGHQKLTDHDSFSEAEHSMVANSGESIINHTKSDNFITIEDSTPANSRPRIIAGQHATYRQLRDAPLSSASSTTDPSITLSLADSESKIYAPSLSFAPPRTSTVSKTKTLCKKQEDLDFHKMFLEYHRNVNSKSEFDQRDFEAVDKVKSLIKACIANTNPAAASKLVASLRNYIHDMEFYHFEALSAIIERSKVLEAGGLPDVFDVKFKDVFPWDVAADAKTLWSRWTNGDSKTFLLKGIIVTKGVAEKSDMNQTGYRIDESYRRLRSAKDFGANGLVNGQWWVNRYCVLRDGAHGAVQGGISGWAGLGATSIVVASSSYDDKDRGDVIEYCGTHGDPKRPSKATKLLIDAHQNRKPIRVLRAANKDLMYAPKQGIRYDGLYKITGSEILEPKTSFYRFTLERVRGQDPIRWSGAESRPTAQQLTERTKIRKRLGIS